MKKIIVSIFIIGLILTGCNKEHSPEETLTIQLIAPAGGPTLAVQGLLEEDLLESYNVNLEFEMITSTDALAAKLVSGEADMAIVPTNLASNLYNKDVDYVVGAVVVWGNLYLIGNQPIDSLEDLKGKSIYTFGQGLTPDIVLKYIFSQNNINLEEEVDLNYISGASGVAPLFLSGDAEIALVPEPILSTILTKKPETEILVDLQGKWAENVDDNSSYPQSVLVINRNLVDNHADLVHNFIKEIEKSINYANENPEKLGDLAESNEIGLTKGIVVKSIPRMNMKLVTAQDAKEEIFDYLGIIEDFNPKAIGGAVPDEDFFIQE